MNYIFIATEDILSEAVAEQLVKCFTNYQNIQKLRQGGNGYLRSNLKKFFEIANRTPFLLVTDLDRNECASTLLSDWLGSVNVPIPEKMLLRVAVREIEAWLLADHQGISTLINREFSTNNPDSILNPKRKLIQLAKKAPRDIRLDITIRDGALATQGPGYNARLVDFVRNTWCPIRASNNSNSLKRCCERLESLQLI